MRHTLLLDNKISHDEIERWKIEDRGFWKTHLGIEPEYEIIRTDYSDYPTYIDSDGDTRPTYAYLKSLNDLVVAKYGEFGTDFIMVMIHEDNFKSDDPRPGVGIWGTNYSYKFGKQNLCYCRWDRDNRANTFGTAYHERHHSFDSLIKLETGVDIQPILDVERYDRQITHGHHPKWDYIRHKENTESLKIMAPYIRTALRKRKEKHEEVLKGVVSQIIKLTTQLLYYLRMKKYGKNGIPR